MKKVYLLGLAGAAFFAGVYIQGCSGDSGTDGGATTCHANADCGTGQLCDTYAGQCVTSCTQGSDCADTEKNCVAAVAPSVASGTYCQCQTDALCGDGFVCSKTDHVCEQKCTSDSNCQGFAQARSCDVATGQCVASAGTDGGTDGGVTDCTLNTASCTGATPYCDAQTKQCSASPDGAVCTAPETEDVCGGGYVCFAHASGNYCEQVQNPQGSCTISSTTSTSPTSDPVIFDVYEDGTTRTDDNCDGTIVEFKGYFYDASNSVTSSYSSVYYVKADGSAPGNGNTAGNTYERVNVDAAGGTFTFELCNPSSTQAGVVLKNSSGPSNIACINDSQP